MIGSRPVPPLDVAGAQLPLLQRLAAPAVFITAALVVSALYAALQLTPSSYAIALEMVGVKDTGLLFGLAQEERSDEWALWTPYFQIAVNNGFARIEHISPYEADLRNFNALPLWDWALIFKPQMWAFFVMPPAPAFSLMFALLLAACWVGYYLLARELGFSDFAAAIFSLAIFGIPYVQLWWTTTGPLVAFFPWLLLACLVPMPAVVRVPLLVWITATLLLSHFYVIFIATLAFAGGVVVIALRPDVVRIPRIATCLVGGAIGFGLSVLYLWGPFQIMAATEYPGHRNEMSGGLLPSSYLFAHFFPHFVTDRWRAFYYNDIEISTGGSYALMFVLVFLDFRRAREVAFARTDEDRATRWSLAVLGIGILIILAWWVLPLPPWVGAPLTWNTSPPQRLAFAMGLLAHLVAFILLLRVGAVASVARLAIAVAAIVIAAALSKFVVFSGTAKALKYDLLILPMLLAAFWIGRTKPRWGYALLLCGAVSNAIVWVSFNPVQYAGPIFAKHDSPQLRELKAKQEAHPRKWLVGNFSAGAVGVGLGFRSIRHVTITPQVAFFRTIFPDLPPDQLNHVFNRFAHVILDENLKAPITRNNLEIIVPQTAFE